MCRFGLSVSRTTKSVTDDRDCCGRQSQKTKFVVDDKSCLFILWQTLSFVTNFVVGDNISLLWLSSKTMLVVRNRLCRGWQTLSSVTQSVVSDEPKYSLVTLWLKEGFQSLRGRFTAAIKLGLMLVHFLTKNMVFKVVHAVSLIS